MQPSSPACLLLAVGSDSTEEDLQADWKAVHLSRSHLRRFCSYELRAFACFSWTFAASSFTSSVSVIGA